MGYSVIGMFPGIPSFRIAPFNFLLPVPHDSSYNGNMEGLSKEAAG
jgi:hypothetical protein